MVKKRTSDGPSPFDYVNELSKTFWDDNEGRGYVPVIVMQSCAQHPDMVLFADDLNTMNVPANIHYTYLLNTVRKRKRPYRWAKAQKIEGLNAIAKHYKCSLSKARQIKPLLDDDFIQRLKDDYGN